MKQITSFCIDHDRLEKGLYISRIDHDIITYDMRMVKPNVPPYLNNAGLHTFEHLFATYVRNSKYSDEIVYAGPMGCRTGFYFLTRDTLSKQDAITLIQETCLFIANFDEEIPGATYSRECGNYLDHNLVEAKEYAKDYYDVIANWTISQLSYPDAKPLSDDYIKEHFVGDIKEHNSTIHLEEYQEEWAILFEKEAKRLKSILNEHAIMIEHIGSTSVKGLCAKPIIDILLVVEDTRKEETYLPALLKHGYTLRIHEPEFYDHHMLKGPDTDINLHVFPKGCIEIDKYLKFRDYLRTHEEARIQYANTKRKLAAQKWKYVQNYADAKSEVIIPIIDAAMKE